MLSNHSFKEQIVNKLFSQFSSIKNAFRSLNKNKSPYILYDDFKEII